MIARVWHGVVPAAKSDSYFEYVRQTGVRDLRATPGNVGVTLMRRREGDRVHIIVSSWWDSLDAIRAFAGSDIERARYYPEDASYLIELEPGVIHYEIVHRAGFDAGG